MNLRRAALSILLPSWSYIFNMCNSYFHLSCHLIFCSLKVLLDGNLLFFLPFSYFWSYIYAYFVYLA